MGCDFYWRGSIKSPEQQARAIAFAEGYYLTAWEPPLIGGPRQPLSAIRVIPNAAHRRRTQFVTSRIVKAPPLGLVPKIEDERPFSFYGLAPYLRTQPHFMGRHQLVFDQARGGRMVTLMDGASLGDEVETDWFTEQFREHAHMDLIVVDKGYERFINDTAAPWALLLNVLKWRYCPNLTADDDYFYFKNVGEELERGRLRAFVCDETKSFSDCLAAYVSSDANETERRSRMPGEGG